MTPDNYLFPLSLIWLVSEILLARGKRSGAGDQSRDRSSLRWLWWVIMLAVSLGTILGFAGVGPVVGGVAVRWLGLLLMIGGLLLRWLAIFSLGKQFTVDVAIREGHQLVTGGLYHRVRHPSYTGSLLTFLGLGLAVGRIVSVLVIFLPILLTFLYRIKVEEQALREQFGAEYEAYCRKTERLVPGVW